MNISELCISYVILNVNGRLPVTYIEGITAGTMGHRYSVCHTCCVSDRKASYGQSFLS